MRYCLSEIVVDHEIIKQRLTTKPAVVVLSTPLITISPICVQDVAMTDNLYRLGDTTKIILHRQQQVEKDVAYLKDSVSEILDQFKGFQSLPRILGQVQNLLSGRRKYFTNDLKLRFTCRSYPVYRFGSSHSVMTLQDKTKKETKRTKSRSPSRTV